MKKQGSAPVEAGEALELAPERPLAASATGGGELQLMPLFERALASPDGVGALAQLVKLQEQMQRREAELEFSRALVRFKKKNPLVIKSHQGGKTGTSPGGLKFKYADYEDIADAVEEGLAAEGFSYTFDTEVNGSMLKSTCTLRHEMGHTSSASFTVPTESSTPVSAQQRYGGARTYAKRMALIDVLGLTLTEGSPEQAKEVASGFLTAEQEQSMEQLITEVGADRAKFLALLKVDAPGKLPASRYQYAIGLLEQKRKAAAS